MLNARAHPIPRASSPRPNMPPRPVSRDEELGKRDDDFRPRKATSFPSSLSRSWQWRRKRVLALLAGIALLYTFFQYLHGQSQSMDLRPGDWQDIGYSSAPGRAPGTADLRESKGAPPRPRVDVDDVEQEHYYDGRIKFYNLASSLRSIARTRGDLAENRNVLFAASSMKSLANLLPMACEMSLQDRNFVHLAVFGRNDLDLEEVLKINGVDADSEECSIYLHDARPDFAPYSTERRSEASVKGAMKHFWDFMHPQAVIVDHGSLEDEFFTRAMRMKTSDLDLTLIEVPAGRYEDFLWISRLESGSLANWYTPEINILVQSPQGNSGGLIRTLKSLEAADYAGMKVPKLTVELPPQVPHFAARYLSHMQWPPVDEKSTQTENMLAVHHRISSARLNSEQASMRFLEAFFPIDVDRHHALVLSPQTELHPLFMQYLHYILLEYRYSSYRDPLSRDLFGIALDVPSSFLNGSSGFEPPKVADMNTRRYDGKANAQLPIHFLYQAPSSSATLIFGDKWATMHDFLSKRLAVTHTGAAKKRDKLVSEAGPSWMEYTLELMRARSWATLHPATPFITVHNELAQTPEEFARKPSAQSKSSSKATDPSILEDEPFLLGPEVAEPTIHIEHDLRRSPQPLHELLPLHAALPDLSLLPHLSHAADLIDPIQSTTQSHHDFLPAFRRDIGGCDAEIATIRRKVRAGSTDDLFCLPGVEMEFLHDEDEQEQGVLKKQLVDMLAEEGAEDVADAEAALVVNLAAKAADASGEVEKKVNG